MPRNDVLSTLVYELVGARFFEDAARLLLESMFECVERSLAETPFASKSHVLRGVIHVRPDGGYQRVYGVNRLTGEPIDGLGFVTSGSVWVWITEHGGSVSIDVHRGSLRAWLPSGSVDRRDTQSEQGPTDATRERMLGRDATHVHAIPLRSPGGAVLGMFTIEVSSKPAIGQEFIWHSCYDELDILGSVGGAFLTARTLGSKHDPTATAADAFLPVVGEVMAPLVGVLRAFAPREDTVLVTGPTGAGKSRLARWCHEHSGRREAPFELVDIHAIPEDLQMGELFGWKRGAFTSAARDNAGAIARAGAGTLFIDEIDKLSLKSQAGLLHFLETRSFRMLGDNGPERTSSARLMVGSNVDLRQAVRAGRFREDLYYRINVLPVRVPGLSERRDEIAGWASFMLERRHIENEGTNSVRYSDAAKALLVAQPWPGNLRQLDNIVRRTYALLLGSEAPNAADPVIGENLVRQALAFDEDSDGDGLGHLLARTAKAFVAEAKRRDAKEGPLSLDLVDGLRGLVLAQAVLQSATREQAFSLLGMSLLVKNRNHHRTLRRELARSREVLAAIGAKLEPAVESLLADDDAPIS